MRLATTDREPSIDDYSAAYNAAAQDQLQVVRKACLEINYEMAVRWNRYRLEQRRYLISIFNTLANLFRNMWPARVQEAALLALWIASLSPRPYPYN